MGDTGYGAGVAVGDIDNDGLVDVYVANYGPDALYHNQGDGKFENIKKSAGISGNIWSASAAFCDYDGDGLLDLYVTHYVNHDPTKVCVKTDSPPDYSSPQSFSYQSDTLYENDGDATFTDVSRPAGIDRIEAPGLGIICSDFTGDGWLDFYIANDGEANSALGEPEKRNIRRRGQFQVVNSVSTRTVSAGSASTGSKSSGWSTPAKNSR